MQILCSDNVRTILKNKLAMGCLSIADEVKGSTLHALNFWQINLELCTNMMSRTIVKKDTAC